ncbi:hypothetical protein [Acinetobacter venetianus]|uniref:hypothetical protein n=1 Tax=Acinetobacter venetianus TaxID=52133 RepID=UPI00077850B2|nr:hypothetical protein [Acinetobacter venetianus]KXZ66812.1 hypothetical protein AVENLUH7437_00626 [Acinetobacter venetianus]
MAYYSGLATDYNDLLNSLILACQNESWDFSSGVLSKDIALIRPYVSLNTSNTEDKGIVFEVASTNATTSEVRPRLGRASQTFEIAFPVNYFFHIYDLEVWCVVKHGINEYLWAGFGVADNRVFASANARRGGNGSNIAYVMDATSGATPNDGLPWNGTSASSCLPFWSSFTSNNGDYNQDTIQSGIDGYTWAGATQKLMAMRLNSPLIARSPNIWNSESILFPITPYLTVASSKVSILAEIKHCRYLRINNLEPEQIIQLGNEKWKIYPAVKKDSLNPNNIYGNHSGTFGMAIRYDGP